MRVDQGTRGSLLGYGRQPVTLPRIDWLLISKYYRRGREVKVGDLVSFRHPVNRETYAVKRVIGMPGDFVLRDTPGKNEVMIQLWCLERCLVVCDAQVSLTGASSTANKDCCPLRKSSTRADGDHACTKRKAIRYRTFILTRAYPRHDEQVAMHIRNSRFHDPTPTPEALEYLSLLATRVNYARVDHGIVPKVTSNKGIDPIKLPDRQPLQSSIVRSSSIDQSL
nr:hypothetical protein CFP56_02934 [Quercus suber]